MVCVIGVPSFLFCYLNHRASELGLIDLMSTFPSSATCAPGRKTIRKITCLGSGFVGGNNLDLFEFLSTDFSQCPTSAVTAFKANVVVTVVDIDPVRIAAWQSESLPIYEPGLYDVVAAARDGINLDQQSPDPVSIQSKNGRINDSMDHNKFTRQPNLFFSTDVDKAIEDADLIFVCVNTPTKRNGVGKGAAPNLGFVEAATRNIAKVATENKIVVEKSTVPCRTAQYIREIVSSIETLNEHASIAVLTYVYYYLALGQCSTWRAFRRLVEPRVSRGGHRDTRSALP